MTKRPEKYSHLEHMCALDYDCATRLVRLTSIICTIGPNSMRSDMIVRMIESGLSIARLNFSHGTHDSHAEAVDNIRIAEKLGVEYTVAIALDTKGPEIRTGHLMTAEGNGKKFELKNGEKMRLTTQNEYAKNGTGHIVWIDYANFVNVVKPGHRIYIDHGLILLIVEHVTDDEILCEIEIGGTLRSHRIVTLPDACIPASDLPLITEKDRADLKWAVEHNVDIIFAAFVRNADTVTEIRQVLGDCGKRIKVISKIADAQGLENLDSIIEASDGIMVDRASLSTVIPPEQVFIAQKMIIARCNKEGKSAISTSQMAESMWANPRAICAEISDVANAVLDGVDAVWISGKFPLDCVKTMAMACKQAEAAVWQHNLFTDLVRIAPAPMDAGHTLAIGAVKASLKCKAVAIIVITTSGRSAQLVSKYRPKCPIIAVTRCPTAARQCHLHRGICPIMFAGRVDRKYMIRFPNNCFVPIFFRCSIR